MIDFTPIAGAVPRYADPASHTIAKGQAAMSAFAAARSARPQKAPAAAPKAAPVASPAPARAATPEQRRVDAFEYPAA